MAAIRLGYTDVVSLPHKPADRQWLLDGGSGFNGGW